MFEIRSNESRQPFEREESALGQRRLGGSINCSDDRFSLYGEAPLNTGLSNPGDSHGLAATAGLRGKF